MANSCADPLSLSPSLNLKPGRGRIGLVSNQDSEDWGIFLRDSQRFIHSFISHTRSIAVDWCDS
jgi:hypothetical protein